MKTNKAAREAVNKNPVVSARVTPARRISEQKGVVIELPVPWGAGEVLPGREFKKIRAASIHSEEFIDERRKQWGQHSIAGLQVVPPQKNHLEEMMRRPLDTLITVFYRADEWARIQRLAESLGISPGQWLLAGVGYAVYVAGLKKGVAA